MSSPTEAFSRVLIDRALQESGCDLGDPQRVRFELRGGDGWADYVLGEALGPLGVQEAKREDIDPYEAREQAWGYAENLRAPFVLLSNGRVHYFWNYARRDQREPDFGVTSVNHDLKELLARAEPPPEAPGEDLAGGLL